MLVALIKSGTTQVPVGADRHIDLNQSTKFQDLQPTGDFYQLMERIDGFTEVHLISAEQYRAHLEKYSPLKFYEWVAAE
jgi:hypothetical protein